jgi:hypothetical protein
MRNDMKPENEIQDETTQYLEKGSDSMIDTSTDIAPDPFDPASLRLRQDFATSAGVKPVLTTVPVRKPNKQDFVRVNPSADYQLTAAVIELKDEDEMYLVAPNLVDDLSGEVMPVTIFTGITRQGTVFLWPAKLPDAAGRSNSWHESALDAAGFAQEKWVRVASDMSLGAYRVWEATGELPEPEWPDKTLRDLLTIAFKGRLIEDLNHPVLKRLRGEA